MNRQRQHAIIEVLEAYRNRYPHLTYHWICQLKARIVTQFAVRETIGSSVYIVLAADVDPETSRERISYGDRLAIEKEIIHRFNQLQHGH